LPHVGPDRSLGFVTIPAGQDPDDLLRAKGRGALEALLEKPEPLVDRLWRHESGAEPLATPEQRAGLRRRLLDHVGTIADADVREQYKSEMLGRFNELTRPKPQPWSPRPQQWKRGGPPGRQGYQPPRPASAETKALGSDGLGAQLSRAVLQGLLRFPQLLGEHAEAVAALPLTSRPAAKLRDSLLSAAMLHGALDPGELNTILARSGVSHLADELRAQKSLAFSFTRRDADPERATRDLVLVIDTLAARPGLDAALEAATSRLQDEGDEAAFQEQQRLREARDEADRQLATLIESDGG
jgi:DNA primase